MFFVKKWTQRFNGSDSHLVEEQVTTIPHNGDNQLQVAVSRESSTPEQRITNLGTSKSKSKLFYDEGAIILPKYSHLKTPDFILKSVRDSVKPNTRERSGSTGFNIEVSYSNSGKEFIQKSVKLSNQKGQKAREIPLQAYWTTFEHLDDKKLKWYLYWREEMLKGNYIEVDLSYIFVFVYELLNYSFNEKAAFNVSALVRIHENYIDMHPKLDNYLPRWIHDMLNELEESKLANEWGSEEHKPTLYKRIVEAEVPIEKISITNWKPYIRNYRETAFFDTHKNKIYKTFKSGVALLQQHYEGESKDLGEIWFETKKVRNVVQLFSGAVIGRKTEPIHVYSDEVIARNNFYSEITELFRMSENIVRDHSGEKRKIKVDNSVLPDEFQEKMMENLRGKSNETKERFKKVQSKNHLVSGSEIPKSPDRHAEAEVAITIASTISFDSENINRLNSENQDLQKLFDELDPITELEEELIEPSILETDVIGHVDSINSYFDNLDINQEEDEEGYIQTLTVIEKEFLISLDNGECTLEDASVFVKGKGQMLGAFLSELNEKAREHLGDNIIELEQDKILLYEEFTFVIETLKGA
ncbi:TerB N-terminal domain-containing protein [Sporosarcina limicola]|uniref:TerB-C domain-containing protein n=1 Tax=Sporosarcina limicola TaxID=34101 RepID=A0A927MM84_9BACL|nr:TerB N-terminal domain-containing protein [Sporosarcina limicola]MBE1555477.1 hypothetical protein [Sporosarcina limicola]